MDAPFGLDLARLAASADEYASLPIEEAVDWSASVLDRESVGEWYLVVFRSVRKPTVDQRLLDALDEAAHLEAADAPGFVHYFKGPLCASRSCLSFCLWSSRHDARTAAGRPAHRAAVSIIGEAYERYTLEFYRVTKHAGDATLTFEPYDPAAAAA